MKHLLGFDQTTKAETDLLLGHVHALKQGFSEDAHSVGLQHLLKGVRVLHFWLRDGLSKVDTVELSQISEEIFVNDFITDDRARVQMIEFKLRCILIKRTFGDAPLIHALVGKQREKLLHGAHLQNVLLERAGGSLLPLWSAPLEHSGWRHPELIQIALTVEAGDAIEMRNVGRGGGVSNLR